MSSTVPLLTPQISFPHLLYSNGVSSTSSPPFSYQPHPTNIGNINMNNLHAFAAPPPAPSNTNIPHLNVVANGSFQQSASATGSLPKSYVSSVEEYLRIVDISLKSIRSLWRSRTSMQQPHQNNASSPSLSAMNDPTVSPSRRPTTSTSTEHTHTVNNNSTTNSQEQIQDSEMINYLIWNCCVMLSKLFISPQPWHFSAFAAHPNFSSYLPFILPNCPTSSQPTTPGMQRSSFGSTQSLFTSSTADIPPYSPCSGLSVGADCTSFASSGPTSPSSSSSPLTPSVPLSPTIPPIYPISLPPPTLTFSHPSLIRSRSLESSLLFNNSPPQLSRAPVTLAYLSDLPDHEACLRLEYDEEENKERRHRPSQVGHTLPTSGSRTNLTVIPSSPISPISPTVSPSFQAQLPVQRLTRSHSSSLFPSNQSLNRPPQRFSSNDIVKAHFCSLFSSPSHPYGYALLTFLNHIQDERGEKMRRWVQEEFERRRAVRLEKQVRSNFYGGDNQGKFFTFESEDKEMHEIRSIYLSRHLQSLRSFIKFYNRLVLSSYPALGSTTFTKKIMLNTLQSFILDSSSKTMITLYAQCFEREDDWMLSRLHDIQQYCSHLYQPMSDSMDLSSDSLLSTNVSIDDLALTFNNLSARFSQTIDLLRSMFTVESIRDKWTFLVGACRMAAVERNATPSTNCNDNLSPNVNRSLSIPTVNLSDSSSSFMASSDDLITTLSFCLAFIANFDDVGNSTAPPASPLSLPHQIITRDRRSSSNSLINHLPSKSYRMYSQMRLMSEWMSERSLIGEKGFCMTTWTCAMEYLAYSSLPILLNTFINL